MKLNISRQSSEDTQGKDNDTEEKPPQVISHFWDTTELTDDEDVGVVNVNQHQYNTRSKKDQPPGEPSTTATDNSSTVKTKNQPANTKSPPSLDLEYDLVEDLKKGTSEKTPNKEPPRQPFRIPFQNTAPKQTPPFEANSVDEINSFLKLLVSGLETSAESDAQSSGQNSEDNQNTDNDTEDKPPHVISHFWDTTELTDDEDVGVVNVNQHQ